MNCRAQLLSLPLTYRYLLTIVDSRQLQEQFLPLRAAMLAAISTDDKEVTQTVLKVSEKEAEEKHSGVSKEDNQQADGAQEHCAEAEVEAEVEAEAEAEAGAEVEEFDENDEEEEQNNEQATEVEDEGEGDEEDGVEELNEQQPERHDAKPIRLQHSRNSSERSSSNHSEESDSEGKRPHRDKKRTKSKKMKSANKKRKSSSDSEPDELFVYAQEKEAAARKLMRKFTKIRSAIRKHSQELATLQHEMAALDLGETLSTAHNKAPDDLSTFEAFMEHRRKREHTHEAFEATAKRLETDKSETKQRFARNTTKLLNIAAPVLDTRAFTQDPDVASALEECSNNSSVVTHYLSHPVATLALTCAQLIHTQSKDAIYKTDRWRAYVAKKRA